MVEEFRNVQGPAPIPLRLMVGQRASSKTWDQLRKPRVVTRETVVSISNRRLYSETRSVGRVYFGFIVFFYVCHRCLSSQYFFYVKSYWTRFGIKMVASEFLTYIYKLAHPVANTVEEIYVIAYER